MLKIENLSLNLPLFKLDNINLSIEDHEYFVLLGSSGSGKTLFLESLAGRYKNSKGKINYNNLNVTNLEPENRNIGFVYQNFELFPNLSVEENIKFPLKLRNIKENTQNEKVSKLLDLLKNYIQSTNQ